MFTFNYINNKFKLKEKNVKIRDMNDQILNILRDYN